MTCRLSCRLSWLFNRCRAAAGRLIYLAVRSAGDHLRNEVMRFFIVTLSIVVAAAAVSLRAQDVPIARLAGASFSEAIRTEAPVSGEDILSLQVRSAKEPTSAMNLYVREPAGGLSSICLDVATIDGGYVASNTYLIPPASPGSYVRIPVDAGRPLGTGHPERFTIASAYTLAIIARRGTCAVPTVDLVPVAWGEMPKPSAEIRIVLAAQSGRSSASLLINDDPKQAHACTSLTAGRRTIFDSLCDFSLPVGHETSIRLRLQRCAFDDCTQAPLVRLLL
jgi:hypothetical protein